MSVSPLFLLIMVRRLFCLLECFTRTGQQVLRQTESSDSLVEEIRASPPPFEYYHGEQLEDDPQLTAGNMKKFQPVVREFTKFSLVSTIVEYFLFLCIYID